VKSDIQVDEDLILGVVSGPEPQRQILESILEQQMSGQRKRSVIVRGIPDGPERKHSQITFINHASRRELGELIQKAAILVTRSGYSTIMDLTRLEKKNVILIPTPGQTEQEYLAEQLDKRKIALCQSQSDFDLNIAIQRVKENKGFEDIDPETNLLNNAVDELLQMKKTR
jgi:predicted glycosyltransferase